jgi:hypothetical protein
MPDVLKPGSAYMGSIDVCNRRSPDASPSGSGSGGGGVVEILNRLGNIETHVSELRSQASEKIPLLATKADIWDSRAALAATETAIIKWIIIIVLASAALAFTIGMSMH